MISKFKRFNCFLLIFIFNIVQIQVSSEFSAYGQKIMYPTINSIYLENNVMPNVGEKVKFIADAIGETLQYTWSVYKDEKEVHFEFYSTRNYFEYTFSEEGIYKVQLTVKDEFSNKVIKCYENIYVEDKNILKMKSIMVDKKGISYVGETLNFIGDCQGKNLNYKWTIYKDYKEIYSKPYSNENILEYKTQEPGIYNAALTVKDEDGKVLSEWSEEVKIIEPLKINSVQVDKKDKQPVNTVLNFTVLGEGSDLTYGWYIYKDSNQVYQNLSVKNNTIQYKAVQPGIYKALVYVKDISGNYLSQYSEEIKIYSNESLKIEKTEKIEETINEKDLKSKTEYFIWVDTEDNMVYVFQGKTKEWKLVKSMLCTDGKASTPTIKGDFSINGRGPWLIAYNLKVKAKYKVRIYKDYYFHSILYNNEGKIVDSRLGKSLSHGCIRLSVENAKWIYDNIKDGTGVHIK